MTSDTKKIRVIIRNSLFVLALCALLYAITRTETLLSAYLLALALVVVICIFMAMQIAEPAAIPEPAEPDSAASSTIHAEGMKSIQEDKKKDPGSPFDSLNVCASLYLPQSLKLSHFDQDPRVRALQEKLNHYSRSLGSEWELNEVAILARHLGREEKVHE